jgi:hypothetical protein
MGGVLSHRFGQSGAADSGPDLSVIMASSPRALYGLRLLNTGYAGDAVRVRRSSDNAEQDIGFVGPSLGAALDTADLLSFVGAGSGYIVTWYDQSGNARDATQATTTKQPRIVNSGSLETADGVPAAFFTTTASSDVLVTNNHNFISVPFAFADGAMTAIAAARWNNSGHYSAVFSLDFTTSGRLAVSFANNGYPTVSRVANSDQPARDTPAASAATWSLLSCAASVAASAANGAPVLLCLNGSNGMRVEVDGFSGSLPSTSTLGGQNFIGHITEAVYYGSELSAATRKTIEEAMAFQIGVTMRNAAVAGTAYGLSGMAGVMGFRKLVSDYDGYCAHVVRSSDSASLFVGFDVSGDMDVTSMMSWAGSDTVYLVAWMDQTGKGFGYQNSVATNAPILAASGSIKTIDGTHIAAEFSGTSRHLVGGFSPFDTAFTSVYAIKRTSGTGHQVLMGRPLSSNALSAGTNNASPPKMDLMCNGVTDTASTLSVTINAAHIVAFRGSSGFTTGNYTVTPSVDGVDGSGLTVNYSTRTKSATYSFLGKATSNVDGFTGVLAELALAPSSLSTGDQNAIETSMGSRFGVTIT